MALTFPTDPIEGQIYDYNSSNWVYTNGAWLGESQQGAEMYGNVTGTAGETIAAGQGVILDKATGKFKKPTQSPLSYTSAAESWSYGASDFGGNFGGSTGTVGLFSIATTAGTLNLVCIRYINGSRVMTRLSLPAEFTLANAMIYGCVAGCVYLGEDKWAVIYPRSTTSIRTRMVTVDPTTGNITLVSLVDTTIPAYTNITCAWGARNPTTGKCVVGYETAANQVHMREITYSGTTVTLGTATTLSVISNTNGSFGAWQKVIHRGVNTTFILQQYGTRNTTTAITANTSGAIAYSVSQLGSVFGLHNAGQENASIAVNGNKALATYCGNYNWSHPVFAPGTVDDGGNVSFRGVAWAEAEAISPNAAKYKTTSTPAVVPSLDVPGLFYVMYNDPYIATTFTRTVQVNEDLSITVGTPQAMPYPLDTYHQWVWTGTEQLIRTAGGTMAFSAPRGMTGQELIGIAASSTSANNTMKVYTVGAVVPGYSGLNAGGMCYVHSGGGIDQNQTYDAVRIGRAVSSTEILVTL